MKQEIENSKGVGLENSVYSRAALWLANEQGKTVFCQGKVKDFLIKTWFMKNLLTEKNDYPLRIGKKFPKCKFTLDLTTKQWQHDGIIYKGLRKALWGHQPKYKKKPANKRPIVVTGNEELRTLQKEICMH